MENQVGWVLLAIAVTLTYVAPLLLAQLFGARASLVGLWHSITFDQNAPSVVLFVAIYVVVGFALWAGPLWFVVTIMRPVKGAHLRRQTVSFLAIAFFPLRPVWERGIELYEDRADEHRERQALKTLYRAEYRGEFRTFKAFLEAYRDPEAYARSQQAPPPEPPQQSAPDRLQDAERLLGLESGYTAKDLRAQYLALIRQFHVDSGATRSDIATRINNARDTVLDAKGWKK